jgi:antitoxin component of RelBE/YafQ-DinJ toxin-antitoxin module
MSYLEQFKEKPKVNGKTDTRTIRLPHETNLEFEAYCNNLNITVSKAIRLLMEKELEGKKIVVTEEQKESYAKSRFTLTKWKREDMVPCPICKEWKSASNFSRHAKETHNLSSEEMFTNEELAMIAAKMML